LEDIKELRLQFLSGKLSEQRIYLNNYLSQNPIVIDGQTLVRWHINGLDVCQKCWMSATTISSFRIKNFFKNRHSSNNITRVSDYVQNVISWMDCIFTNMGEKLPHRNEIHLPSFLSWKAIFIDLTKYLSFNNFRSISFSYFCYLRRKYFKNVTIPEKSRLGKCDTCLTLQQRKFKCTNPVEYQNLSDEFVLHNQLQMKERLLYKQRATLGKTQPSQYLSLIVDTMQTKFIPMVTPLPKNYSTCEKLRLHLTGIINHSHSDRIMYGSFDHWKHGSNFVVSVIDDYLRHLQLKLDTDAKPWPSTLFLQLDNCWKENKNKYVFSYLASLIHYHIFNEIYMHCLPTGHTHEDIDQMFSSFSINYWRHGFQSIPKMDAFISNAYPSVSTRPRFKMVTSVFDIKTFFSRFLVQIEGILIIELSSFIGIPETMLFLTTRLPVCTRIGWELLIFLRVFHFFIPTLMVNLYLNLLFLYQKIPFLNH